MYTYIYHSLSSSTYTATSANSFSYTVFNSANATAFLLLPEERILIRRHQLFGIGWDLLIPFIWAWLTWYVHVRIHSVLADHLLIPLASVSF